MEERTDCLSSDYLYQIIVVTVGGICVEVHSSDSTHESQLLTAPVLGLLSLGRAPGALGLLATSVRAGPASSRRERETASYIYPGGDDFCTSMFSSCIQYCNILILPLNESIFAPRSSRFRLRCCHGPGAAHPYPCVCPASSMRP